MLRLAFFQAANAARRHDPQLAGFYHRLMTEHGHCHTQACVAVARKLVERTWTVLTRGTPYQLRDARRSADQPPRGEAGDQGPLHRSRSCPGQGPGAQRSHEPGQADPLNRAATPSRSSDSCHPWSALRRAQRGAPARRASQMTVAGRTTLTSTNADPQSSSGGTALRHAHDQQAIQHGLTTVRESLRI